MTIVGRFPAIQPGRRCASPATGASIPSSVGSSRSSPAQETKPATLTGLEKYLGSGLIKGIGPVTARRIVAHFGLETLAIIEEQASD